MSVVVVFSWVLAFEAYAESPERVRLFILSGQSNMVHVVPEQSFTPIVQKAFPGDEIIVVHCARSGQLIRMWYKDWQAPTDAKPGGRGKNGRHYDQLMTEVQEKMAGRPKPASVTFVWMQGEADGRHAGYGGLYGRALAGLLEQLQKDLGRNDVYFVVGRISDYGNDKPDDRPDWNTVREEQVKFAEADARRAWVDSDDLNGKTNGLHYPKEGYAELGKRFATAAVELIKAEEGDAGGKQAGAGQ
jgi:hypothetical protein